MIVKIEDANQKKSAAREILEDLPEWFGLPDSAVEYVNDSAALPFWAEMRDGKAMGFAVLKETGEATAELYVMGVRKECQGTGIGRALFEALLSYARNKGYSFLQVKTVQEGHYEEYDRTIHFYKKMGFREFECFPTLWDEWNPCQLFVMYICEK